jgi:hypothetical protein
MRDSAENRRQKRRLAHLEAERHRYLGMSDGLFRLTKGDDKDPTVIWEGTVSSPTLKKDYQVQIKYGPYYPFRRPQVFPCDEEIRNNRHQNPHVADLDKPGDICLFQDSMNDWVVGISCEEIIERAIRWFEKYEAGTLGEEAAPPEIERYYPRAYRLPEPLVVIAETVASRPNGQTSGDCYLVPTASGKRAFLALGSDSSWPEQLLRLSQLLFSTDKTVAKKVQLGLWYLVDKEPFPVPLTMSELLKFIAQNGRGVSIRELCREFTKTDPKLVALRYPVRDSSGRWLVYQVSVRIPPLGKDGVPAGYRPKSAHQSVLQRNRTSPVKLLPAHHVSLETLFRRMPGQTSQAMGTARVLLLGCGTIGSRVAETLIKSGLGNLVLVDNDKLTAGNVCRHVLGLNSLGENKAEALRDDLLRRNPFAEIRAVDANVLANHGCLSLLVRKADLVVCCIGNDAVETWVNECVMASGKPVLFCRTHAHATIGQLILARAGQGCFECTQAYLAEPDCPIPPLPTLDFAQMVDFDTDCGATFIPASTVDIDLVCLHAARLAIQLLLDGPLAANYWLIRGRSLHDDENWELADKLRSSFQVLQYRVEPKQACEVCGRGYVRP